MRRILPYAALLTIAVLAGGCAFTDYNGFGPVGRHAALKDANLSHQGVACADWDKVPGMNSQQNFERLVATFDRVSPPGGGACGVTKVGTVSFEEARDWERFLGPMSLYNGLAASGYGGCLDATWELLGVKGLSDDSVRLHSYRYDLSVGFAGAWGCGMAGFTSFAGILPPENTWMADDAQGFAALNVYNRAPTGIWAIALDRDPVGFGWQNNFVAFNDDETGPNRCDNCLSTMVGMNFRYNEGHFFNAALKGSAGLAEFFNGEPLTVNWQGFAVSLSGRLEDDGRMAVSIHSIEKDGSLWAPSKPLVVSMTREGKLMRYDGSKHEGQLVSLAQWALQNVDMSKPMDLSGFIPELGISGPPVTIKLVEGSIRNFVQVQTSCIEPRRRSGVR